MKVRIATPEDRIEVLRLLTQAHDENGIFPCNWDKVEKTLDRILHPELIPEWDSGSRGVIGVIGDDELEGLAILMIESLWYTSAKHLYELLIYVDVEHRKKPHALTLIKWTKEQSKATGLKLLVGVASTHRTQGKIRLYEKQLDKAGAFFVFDPQGARVEG